MKLRSREVSPRGRVVYWKDSSLSTAPAILSPRAVERVYNSAALRRNPRKKERDGGLEPDLRLSLLHPLPASNPLSTYPPTRLGVGCITIGSRARCTRARKSLCSISISRQVNPFDVVTCQRLNLAPTLARHKAPLREEGRNRAYFDLVNDPRKIRGSNSTAEVVKIAAIRDVR